MNDYDPTPPITTGKDYHDLYHSPNMAQDCPHCEEIRIDHVMVDVDQIARDEAEELEQLRESL